MIDNVQKTPLYNTASCLNLSSVRPSSVKGDHNWIRFIGCRENSRRNSKEGLIRDDRDNTSNVGISWTAPNIPPTNFANASIGSRHQLTESFKRQTTKSASARAE